MTGTAMELLQEQLQDAIRHAEDSHRANRETGAPAESMAFDSGRIDGLRQALDIVDRCSG